MKFLMKIALGFLIVSAIIHISYTSITGYITASDKNKFIDILSATLKSDDIVLPYYGAKGLTFLKQPFDKTVVVSACANLKKSFKTSVGLEGVYNALGAWSLLGCQGKLHTDATIKELVAALENEKSTTSDIHYALETLDLLKQQIPNPQKIAQLLIAKLKEDDSLSSIGHALHAASFLGNEGKFAAVHIEDVVVQADEVNGKLLQWEGGLSISSLLITGLLKFPKENPLNLIQAEKLANYLLTRRTVQTPKGVLALLEAATALVSSSISPVSLSIVGPSYVTVEKPDLKVQVSDIFGQPSKPIPQPVVAQSVKRKTDDSVVLTNQPLVPGSSQTEFVLTLKLEPGFYEILLKAGSHSASLNARVLGPISVKSLEIGLTDADGSSAPKLTPLTYPNSLNSPLKADSSQQLLVKFSPSHAVHQAFIRLYTNKKEIIFVAEQDSNRIYKAEVNLANELSHSGNFDIELILGDAIVTNPILWKLGSIELSLGTTEPPSSVKVIRGPKPEIVHIFRPAEKRPPEMVSLFFTAQTAAPFLILLILWAKIGINLDNFTALALPFHLGFGAILALFTLFWLKLDMFITCAALIPIGGFTFLAGHKLLSHIAKQRKQEKADK